MFGQLVIAAFLIINGDAIDLTPCPYPLDIVFLQDTTGSLQDDTANVMKVLGNVLQNISQQYPGSFFGVAEFRDKPYYPLGETDDFCYKRNRYGALTDIMDYTLFAYSILSPSGGGDLPEDHYQAIVNTLLDPNIMWRPLIDSSDPISVSHIDRVNRFYASARIVVVLTDATPHYNGQMALYPPSPDHPTWLVPQDLPPNQGTIVDGNLTYACLEQDYLDPTVFKSVVIDNNATILTLHTPETATIWSWINEDLLEQPATYRQIIDESSANFTDALYNGLAAITADLCPKISTTTTTVTPSTPTTPSVTTEGCSPYGTTTAGGECPPHDTTTAGGECPPPYGTTTCGGEAPAVMIKLKDKPQRLYLEVVNNNDEIDTTMLSHSG